MSTLLSDAGTEPNLKVFLAVLAILALGVGCYCIYRLVQMRLQKSIFHHQKSDLFGNNWEIETRPVGKLLR